VRLHLAALLLALAACAGARTAPHKIEFEEPLVVEATKVDLELAAKNDEELFAIGRAAQAAGDYARAASAFSRIGDLFPGSPHRAAALFDAGLSYRSLGQWRPALERFRTLAKEYSGPDADEAAFRMAECLYNLRQLSDARAELDTLAERKDLGPALRIRALDQRGIVELDMGDLEASGRSLRAALTAWDEAQDHERLDEHYAAEAQYYLGELGRRRFQAVQLDPSKEGTEALADALERKAQLLLTAQGHYLKAVRMRDPEAVVASGYRIGTLYDELYTQLVQAPLPPDLDAEEQAAYREELRQRVRVLVLKAIRNYEETLAIAQRAGVTSGFVEATHASLERMKGALREVDARPMGP
jgi:hypothetical protein